MTESPRESTLCSWRITYRRPGQKAGYFTATAVVIAETPQAAVVSLIDRLAHECDARLFATEVTLRDEIHHIADPGSLDRGARNSGATAP